MSQNKVTFGFDQVHIAFFDDSNPSQPAWKTPVKLPGAVSFTPTAQGETSTFYADNMAYFVVSSNNGYTGPLVIANLPDAIKAEMYGWEIDSNGMVVEIADAIPKHFALIGQVKGDKRNRRFIYYDCVAARPEKAKNTQTESITPDTVTLNLTVSPIVIGDKTIVKGDLELSDTNSAAYNAFFSAVTVPTFGAVNKTALAALIALAGSLTEAEYTTGSWDALETALANATTVNGNSSATQNQVDAAHAALGNAIMALEVVSP